MRPRPDWRLAANAGVASAFGDKGGCKSPATATEYSGPATTLFGAHKNLPVYQAAPWYNYWPYDAHFLAPAPVSGPFYGPPLTGNFRSNLHFPARPAPSGSVPAEDIGGYGHIPGGPAPGLPVRCRSRLPCGGSRGNFLKQKQQSASRSGCPVRAAVVVCPSKQRLRWRWRRRTNELR